MEVAQEQSGRAPAPAALGTDRRPPVAPRWVLAVAGLVVLVGVVLRFVARSELWLDEALTVNIAKLPLGDLRDALRHDGAPPLYYALLHGWMKVFGSGNEAVRALSGLFSVATLPLAWFAGRRLGRPGPPGPVREDTPQTRLVAALAVLVFVASPYMIRFATEARMYSLVMFLVTAGYLALRRAIERPSLARLAVVALIAALMLYTHYWTIYLLVVVGIGVVWSAFRASSPERRRAARRVLGALVVGALAFVPWLDTFRYQTAHTGTPWGPPQLPWFALRQAIDQYAGGDNISHGEANVMVVALSVLALLAVFGRSAGTRHVDLDLRTRPAVRWEAAAGVSALVLGTIVTWASGNGFAGRYGATAFPLIALVVAYGFTVFSSRAAMGVALAAFVALGLLGGVRAARDLRTQAADVAAVIGTQAQPGDVVVYCPDQLGPAVSRLLGDRPDLVQMTFPSGDRPELVNWVDYLDRVEHTGARAFADRVLARAGDHTIWYVSAPDYGGVKGKCEAITANLARRRPGATQPVALDNSILFELDNLYRFPAA
jgi:uncharacterized membrane protein